MIEPKEVAEVQTRPDLIDHGWIKQLTFIHQQMFDSKPNYLTAPQVPKTTLHEVIQSEPGCAAGILTRKAGPAAQGL